MPLLQFKIVLLFEDEIQAPDRFPQGIDSNVSVYLRENMFETRSVGNGKIRCNFRIDEFIKLKSILEKFENVNFKKSSGQASLINHSVSYYVCCFSGTSVSTHGFEPRSQNCDFKISFHFNDSTGSGFVDLELQRHSCSAKSSQFIHSHRTVWKNGKKAYT